MKHNTDPFIWQPDSSNLPLAASGDKSMPLSGLRLAVKDLFHIAGLPTGAGNPDWLTTHDIPVQTSPVVAKLLDAGTQLVGKTLTDELAYSLNGQNTHYGTPINATDSSRLPGGSSSGSAAAVAHDLADIGLGTDTGGSIRVPSSYNGLFGLRPTYGLISSEQMVGLAPRFDTVGWMTRDLTTLQQVAEVLFENTSQFVTRQPPEIIWSDSLNNLVTHDEDIRQFLNAITGSAIDFPVELLATASEAFRVLQGREIWRLHGDWISTTKPVFSADIAARFKWCSEISDTDEKQAEEQAQLINTKIEAILAGNKVLIMPTTPGPAPLLNTSSEDLVNYRNHLMGLTSIAALGGLPQLHIPLKTEGAAYGISLLGNQNTELQLISVAMELTAGKLSV